MTSLTLGFSPCPNDTFVFDALVHRRIDLPEMSFETRLADVEELNRLALEGALDVTKVSYGVLPYILDEYVLLRSGGALGHGCGPLLVARDLEIGRNLENARIAVPGIHTTAYLLLRLFAPTLPPAIEMRYDDILGAVAEGRADAGLIIHESRFTYPSYGLRSIVDLGEWWQTETGGPIPLGAIVARRSLGSSLPVIDAAIRRSVQYAFEHPDASADYVREHAQEMAEDVRRRHIELYVNEQTVDIGQEGESAIRELVRRAAGAGLLPARDDLWVGVRSQESGGDLTGYPPSGSAYRADG